MGHPVCEGMMHSAKYIAVIDSRIKPQLQEHFPNGDCVLQQDRSPCHTSKAVQRHFEANNIKVMEWPGNSPDIAPIENLWAIIKSRLQNLDCITKEKVKKSVVEVWKGDAEIQKICKKLVDSMPKRILDIIKSKGADIKYY